MYATFGDVHGICYHANLNLGRPRNYISKCRAVHKDNFVSGEAAGWLKKAATGDFFFPFFQKTKIFKKMDKTFLQNKKGEK